MDDLSQMGLLASSGAIISPEQATTLSSSLVSLRDSGKFASVRFWGKISGVSGDYFVAQGLGTDHFAQKSNFYSTDCMTWAQLPELHAVTAASAARIRGRFSGDAGRESTVVEPAPAPGSEPNDLPAEVSKKRLEQTQEDGSKVIQTSITEDQRLAATVAAIERDAAIVPRGAYHKTPVGTVEASRTFEGLSLADAKNLQSYMHFREAVNMPKKSLIEQSKLDKALDFLDPISEDVPTTSWSLQLERGGAVVVLRSLVWPGLSFFHVPNSRKHGYVYFGTAEHNGDLAFMLP